MLDIGGAAGNSENRSPVLVVEAGCWVVVTLFDSDGGGGKVNTLTGGCK
jgi:hypothetical protein